MFAAVTRAAACSISSRQLQASDGCPFVPRGIPAAALVAEQAAYHLGNGFRPGTSARSGRGPFSIGTERGRGPEVFAPLLSPETCSFPNGPRLKWTPSLSSIAASISARSPATNKVRNSAQPRLAEAQLRASEIPPPQEPEKLLELLWPQRLARRRGVSADMPGRVELIDRVSQADAERRLDRRGLVRREERMEVPQRLVENSAGSRRPGRAAPCWRTTRRYLLGNDPSPRIRRHRRTRCSVPVPKTIRPARRSCADPLSSPNALSDSSWKAAASCCRLDRLPRRAARHDPKIDVLHLSVFSSVQPG